MLGSLADQRIRATHLVNEPEERRADPRRLRLDRPVARVVPDPHLHGEGEDLPLPVGPVARRAAVDRKIASLLIILIAALPLAYSQLRNHSPYDQDRINPEQTGFILHDNGTVDFQWTSEWTEMTAQSCNDEAAIFIWHLKDGTKAYSRQGELVADFGKSTAYLLAQKSSTLEDASGKKSSC